MKRLFALVTLLLSGQLLTGNSAHADTPLIYANSFTHQSSLLKEERQYSIMLPPSYQRNSNQYYPVVYLLDGESKMLQAAGILSAYQGSKIPEVIMVGVYNTSNNHRLRDYTPTHTLTMPNGSKGPGYQQTGGGRQFLDYLTQELIPLIEKQYRTAKPNILAGHSLGGLVTLEAISQHQDDFQGFIAMDSSLWFDYPSYYNHLEKQLTQPFKAPASLYFATANNPFTPSLGRSNMHRDNMLQFAKQLEDKAAANLTFKSVFFEDEDHYSVYHPALHQGLKWLFTGYELDYTPGEFTLEKVSKQYQELNTRLHSNIKPDAGTLQRLEARAKLWPTMAISVAEVQKINAHFYPKAE